MRAEILDELPSMFRSQNEYRASARKITIYDTLSGEKRVFEPIDKSPVSPKVKMYVCGLTPQDHAHMGHGLMAFRFDMIRRYLQYRRLDVNFVQNVTDIDDKIINKERELSIDPMVMTRQFTDEFYTCLKKFNVLPVDRLVKVTECVPEIITFIEKLIQKEFAYVTDDGSVYFDVSKKDDYGKLSNQNTAMLYESVRKELDKQKRSPLDFALWKADQSTTLSYPSPWGIGRPGWHIECSVMIHETLGDHIDIHGGGLDLKFPHHENEIAQSEAYTGGSFSDLWMHSGLLNINGQKMSKSLNNFVRLIDALELYGTEPLKFVIARHHYRSGVDLSDKLFRDNLNALLDFHRLLARVPNARVNEAMLGDADTVSVVSAFEAAMDNDFNSPEALVALEQFRAKIAQSLDAAGAPTPEIEHRVGVLRELGAIVGVFFESLDAIESQGLTIIAHILKAPPCTPSEARALLVERVEARATKNFARSDEIRNGLAARGVEVLDSKSGSTWRFA
jgi:cysteinyl-tRNA synthetase